MLKSYASPHLNNGTPVYREEKIHKALSGTIKTERNDQKIEVSILANFMTFFFMIRIGQPNIYSH